MPRIPTTSWTTAALTAATLVLSLSLAVPAFARGGDAVERQSERLAGLELPSAEPRFRQTADSGSGAFFDVNYTQTVETKRLKRRRHKR